MSLLRKLPLVWLTSQVALGALHFQSPSDLPAIQYDFIVIGGGTAGAAVATRLGEKHHFKFLVIEAGPSNEEMFETHPPGLARALAGTRADWNYTTAPQPGINNGLAIPYSRAKMLGGCSSHNLMAYTRGSRDDYDRWASITGDKELSWDKIYPYILKTEKWTRDIEHQDVRGHFDPSVHSRTGKVSVSAPYPVHPFSDLLFEAMTELGAEFPFKLDMNDGRPIGIARDTAPGWGQSTINRGMRSSSATGYLASTGTNIHVLLNTPATRVISLNGGNADFRGVEFAASIGGSRRQLIARKEVILSGGVINTPQILLNSGIGRRAELESFGIKTLVDSPSVGKNLSDQVAVVVNFGTNIAVTDLNRTAALAEWNISHTGPLSRIDYTGIIGWVRLPEDARPFKDGFADPSAGKKLTAYRPKIDLQFFKEPVDIAILREGIRSARRLFSAPVWESKVFGTVAPPADATADAELDAFITKQVVPFLHGIGTAGMSPRGAKWGVVDPDFTVKGTRGLRVVDASVIPYVTSGHTQAPVYAIAERASALIKRAWD